MVKKELVQLIDTIYVKGLQQFDTSNTVIADLNWYKYYKYRFLVDNILFSAAITNKTNVILITCNGLNEAKKALINGKWHKILCVINLYLTGDWI